MTKDTDWKLDIIPKVQDLLEEYPYKPTVRAIFYRLVSDNVIPNTYDKYKGLIQALSTARERKEDDPYHISVYAFADDTRRIDDINDTFVSTEEYVDLVIDRLKNPAEYYHLPKWYGQPNYVEVMIEKDALRGSFREILEDREVRRVPNRGWSSKIYKQLNIDRMFRKKVRERKKVFVLYFGDYDPSGLRMSLRLQRELASLGITMVRVGLNQDQISDYGLDHLRNPDPDVMEKLQNDTNREEFKRHNNGELFQIELDALQKQPEDFRDLVQNAVDKYFDSEIYERNLKEFSPKKIDALVKQRVRFLES